MVEVMAAAQKRKVCTVAPPTSKTPRKRFRVASDWDDVTFETDAYVSEILPQVNEPGHQNSAEARKAAVEAASVSAPPGMSVQKLEEKYRTIVCRHWLRGLCMKGEQCEFLHQYDLARMPLCRWGMNCKTPDCPYRHVAEDDKPRCVFYQQGFCVHGLSCRYRHYKQPANERPVIADFSLGIAQNRGKFDNNNNDNNNSSGGGNGHYGRAGDRKDNNSGGQGGVSGGGGGKNNNVPNEYFKISLCKHHMNGGMCPFGDECHFAHGAHELRQPPRRRSSAGMAGDR